MNKHAKIFVAGHRGLAGGAIVRSLQAKGFTNLVLRTRQELDLSDTVAVRDFIASEKPDCIVIAAAMVGGIMANNTMRSEFLFKNLQIQNNLIWSAHECNTERVVFLGSSCIYPRMAPQPMKETHLLSGPMEPTNRPYALAKIAGLELIAAMRTQYGRNWFSAMPTNLYGPGDNFHVESAHVLPALLRRFLEANESGTPEVKIWGSGKPMREFMYVDDCADAVTHLMTKVDIGFFEGTELAREGWCHINCGTGEEISIADLSRLIAKVVGYAGTITLDASKPDGPPRKLMDNSILRSSGWQPKVSLEEGLRRTLEWFKANRTDARQ